MEKYDIVSTPAPEAVLGGLSIDLFCQRALQSVKADDVLQKVARQIDTVEWDAEGVRGTGKGGSAWTRSVVDEDGCSVIVRQYKMRVCRKEVVISAVPGFETTTAAVVCYFNNVQGRLVKIKQWSVGEDEK